jgi:outer membrane protein assembly factor BamB
MTRLINKIVFLTFFLLACISLNAQIQSEWRGIGRTGVYPESGLMKQWPENGPELLWVSKDLPKGNSSVAIGENAIYLTGLIDTMDILLALDLSGTIIWKTPYGRSWKGSYPESRSTPTLVDDRLYVSSGFGDLACVDAFSGKLIWSVQSQEQFGGLVGRWGIAESPLVVGNIVVYTCGGPKTTVVGIDKETGKTVWISPSLNDSPSYSSPLLIEKGGKKEIIAVTEKNILAVSPENGNIIWTFNYGDYTSPDKRNNHPNTPLYSDGYLFMSSGYDHKSVMLKLSDNATSVSLVWVDSTFDVHLGGMVKLGKYIYGSNWQNNGNGNWACLDWDSGKVMYETKWFNKGAIISADGMLYCYEEKTGNIALVKPVPEKFDVVSSFRVPYGTGPHWAHPVIHNKILYIRHGETLIAYSIETK